jgi:GNAT superfamily N-acetyltransferase
MKARIVTEQDREAVYTLSKNAHAEGRYSRYPIHMAKVESLFNRAIEDKDFFCIVAEDGSGQLVGFFYGLVVEHFFSNMRYAMNAALYVEPAFRGSWAARMLVRKFEQIAIERGADEIMIGATSDINPARVVSFYYALGYQPVGANCVKYIGETDGKVG